MHKWLCPFWSKLHLYSRLPQNDNKPAPTQCEPGRFHLPVAIKSKLLYYERKGTSL